MTHPLDAWGEPIDPADVLDPEELRDYYAAQRERARDRSARDSPRRPLFPPARDG